MKTESEVKSGYGTDRKINKISDVDSDPTQSQKKKNLDSNRDPTEPGSGRTRSSLF